MLSNFGSSPQCPVEPPVREWIEARMEWLVGEFGIDQVRLAKVVLPTGDFFPNSYQGTQEETKLILEMVCRYMDVDPDTVELRLYGDRNPLLEKRTAGLYQKVDDKYLIWIEETNLHDPPALVATMAHELAHVLLLGHGRILTDAQDHEPLTDLLTVFVGLGVITANSVIRESYWQVGYVAGWSMSRKGYLTMPMYGYALAMFTRMRSENPPSWLKHLRGDVESAFTQSARFLSENPPNIALRSIQIPPFPTNDPSAPSNEAEAEDAGGEETEIPAPSAEELLERYARGERDFHHAELRQLRLAGAVLRGSNLTEADLHQADLSSAVLSNCDFRDADLRWVNLQKANLRGAKFNGADLTGADLSGANLSNADLRDADLTGALLRGTKLIGAVRNRRTEILDADFTRASGDGDWSEDIQPVPKKKVVRHLKDTWFWILCFGWSGFATIFGIFPGIVAGTLVCACLGTTADKSENLNLFVIVIVSLAIGLLVFRKISRLRS